MRTILVLNSKGGSGKTTIATNMAAFYALRGKAVTLIDFDTQRSSMDWLAERPDNRPAIHGISGAEGSVRVPRHTEVLVMDAPAALHGPAINPVLRRTQTVVVPVAPSPIDMRAANRFHAELTHAGRVNKHQVKVGTVANRVRELSPGTLELEATLRALKFADGKRLPFVACLRQSQNYLRAAERGLSIFEIAPSLTAHDVALWKPLLRWLNSKRSLPDS